MLLQMAVFHLFLWLSSESLGQIFLNGILTFSLLIATDVWAPPLSSQGNLLHDWVLKPPQVGSFSTMFPHVLEMFLVQLYYPYEEKMRKYRK